MTSAFYHTSYEMNQAIPFKTSHDWIKRKPIHTRVNSKVNWVFREIGFHGPSERSLPRNVIRQNIANYQKFWCNIQWTAWIWCLIWRLESWNFCWFSLDLLRLVFIKWFGRTSRSRLVRSGLWYGFFARNWVGFWPRERVANLVRQVKTSKVLFFWGVSYQTIVMIRQAGFMLTISMHLAFLHEIGIIEFQCVKNF